MPNLAHLTLTFGMLTSASSAYALDGERPTAIPPSAIVDTGSVFQAIFSLLLVLAVIVAVVWLLKRLNVAQNGAGNLLKVIGSVAIGQRERVVLVEVKDTWLLIGVGPGQIRTLHTQEKTEELLPDSTGTGDKKFANMLSSIVSRRTSERDTNAS